MIENPVPTTENPTSTSANPKSSFGMFEISAIFFIIIACIVSVAMLSVAFRPPAINTPAEQSYHNVDIPGSTSSR